MKSFWMVLTAVCSALFCVGCGQQQSAGTFTDQEQTTQIVSEAATTTPAAEAQAPAIAATTVTTAQTPATVVSPTPMAAAGSSPQTASAALPTDAVERTKRIQTALRQVNLYTGEIDGKVGPLTVQAVKDFQTAHNLKVDGKVGPITWGELSKYVSSPGVSASEGSRE